MLLRYSRPSLFTNCANYLHEQITGRRPATADRLFKQWRKVRAGKTTLGLKYKLFDKCTK